MLVYAGTVGVLPRPARRFAHGLAVLLGAAPAGATPSPPVADAVPDLGTRGGEGSEAVGRQDAGPVGGWAIPAPGPRLGWPPTRTPVGGRAGRRPPTGGRSA